VGEWRKLVPYDGTQQSHAMMLSVIGAAALVVVQILTWTGRGSGITVIGSLASVLFTIACWRAARTGVYIGPRGVKLYHPFKRVEVVRWDDAVRFEVRPVRLPNLAEEGAVICLVGSRTHETPIKLSRSQRYNWAAYLTGYDIVLPEGEFLAAVAALNRALPPPRARRPL
jgi:hypothetical protein